MIDHSAVSCSNSIARSTNPFALHTYPTSRWYEPLFPENKDQGDPYLIVSPKPELTSHRYYVYTTGGGDSTNGAFPVYGSHNLIEWEKLGNSLEGDRTKDHWAPAVVYIEGLERPWVMLYSHGAGQGDLAHQEQRLYRADAMQPQGPFRPSGHAITPELNFAIDPDLFPLRDGSWRLLCAIDFDGTSDFELGQAGTGIAIGRLNADLTKWIEPLVPLARGSANWQIYNSERNDQHWKTWHKEDQPVCWYCMEGPASLTEEVIAYSAGNFNAFYAMGVLSRGPDGSWIDLHAENVTKAFFRPHPQGRMTRTGHGMFFVHPDDGQFYLIAHAEYEEKDRQMTIVPIARDENGIPFGPLT